jgi:hypothetical protein
MAHSLMDAMDRFILEQNARAAQENKPGARYAAAAAGAHS